MANYSVVSAYTASRATEAAIAAIEAKARAEYRLLEAKAEAELPQFFCAVSQLVINTAESGYTGFMMYLGDINYDRKYKDKGLDLFCFSGVISNNVRKTITETLEGAGYSLEWEDEYSIRIKWEIEDEGV